MAEGKVIGKLTNIVNFSTDKASLARVLKDIKKVKDEMKGLAKPLAAAQKPMQAMKKMKSDYLVVQKQLDKTEKSQLKTAEAIYKAKNKQALAEQKIANQRRAQSVRGLTSKSGAGRASQTAFADMLRQEERASKLATRATTTANNRNMRVDRRAQATQEWFGSTFGRGGQRKAASLYGDLRSGKINAEQYSTRLRSLRADLYRTQRAQRGFNQSIHDMRGAFVQATASYTAFAGVMAAADIGKQYESRYAGMLVGTGSAEEAKNQISYLDKEVYRLGLDMNVASQGLVQMSVAANGVMQGGQLQDLFTGLSELSTAVKLDPFRYEKAIMAISQMLNKGQLMAEEVKGQ